MRLVRPACGDLWGASRLRLSLLNCGWLLKISTTVLEMKEKPHPCLRNIGVAASCAPRPGTCDLWQGEDSGLASAA